MPFWVHRAFAGRASILRQCPLLGFNLLQVVGPVQESAIVGCTAISPRRLSLTHPAPMGAVALHWRVPGDAAAPGPGRFLVLALVLVVAAVIHAIVFLFPQWYPQTYDDQGLTRFKIASYKFGMIYFPSEG